MTVFVIGVSAGHHPQAKGATWRGVSEFDVTVPWQEELFEQIRTFDPIDHLYLQPKLIEPKKLWHKVEQINKAKCDLAIEIHFNAGAKTNGCETLYAPGSTNGLSWAKVINVHLHRAMGNKNRGVKEGWYRMDQPGVVDYDGDVDGDEKPDYFLAKTRMTALILEPEFMFEIENIREKMVEACTAILVGINELAERKHHWFNLPPEERDDAG